jgi:hypothetical protein
MSADPVRPAATGSCAGGGLASKVHAVVDANGLPVRLGLIPGEAHDNRLCPVLLAEFHPPTMLLADRGYDADFDPPLAARL